MHAHPYRGVLGVFLAALAAAGCTPGNGQSEHAGEARAATREPASPDTAALPLALPTGNLGLLTGDREGFFQAVNRESVPGLREAGWEGGQYGFVRGPISTPSRRVFTQLHEGVDIRPQFLDAEGEPLDTVRAVMPGTVVYVNASAGSAYGRYVVVRHAWDGPVYTLYAHLAEPFVEGGQRVGRRQPLGRMGYTGSGLARHRAHVHFEVALLLNEEEPAWFEAYHGGQPNLHGLYFGTNLAGVDVPALYEALGEDPALSFAAFVRSQSPGYRIALPGDRPLDLLRRYPWLWEGDAPPRMDTTGAWAVTFTREGVPIRVARTDRDVERPEVLAVSREIIRGQLSTNGVLTHTDSGYVVTARGRRYLALIATTEADGAPRW